MDLSPLLDITEQQLSKYPTRWGWSIWNQFCVSGWILPRSHASLSSQILGAFHLSRSFWWHRDPGSFASSEPSQGKRDLHLSPSLAPAWISQSSHFSLPYSNSLEFPLLATLIHSLNGPGCFFPAWDLFALHCLPLKIVGVHTSVLVNPFQVVCSCQRTTSSSLAGWQVQVRYGIEPFPGDMSADWPLRAIYLNALIWFSLTSEKNPFLPLSSWNKFLIKQQKVTLLSLKNNNKKPQKIKPETFKIETLSEKKECSSEFTFVSVLCNNNS